MIKLRNVTKIYESTDQTIKNKAVDDVTLDIPDSEICILVGPSGCGKTTTLKMINRLISLTRGKIYINEEDIIQLDPIELRRKIGYVIQEIGLFPHMTVGENIAVVPSLRNWSREKKRKRVDELLVLVGMDPAATRDKYPRELSGGQRQRIGVARALGTDPPIMLMDEPFGAIDPITRERLQDEFLKIQNRLKKTVVFVTHDINEAIKMGNSIALMKNGKLVQHDTVDELLANPKNKFVEDFVGTDRALKRLMLVRVEQAMQKDPPRVNTEDSVSKVRERMAREKIDNLLVTDKSGVLKGYVRSKALQGKIGKIEQVVHPVSATVEEGTNLRDALVQMLISDLGYLSVVDDRGKLKGLLTTSTLRKVVGETYTAKGGPLPRYESEAATPKS